MSLRVSLPTKLIPILRQVKGKIETHIQRYHFNPDKEININVLKPKKGSRFSQLTQYYRNKGKNGFREFSSDILYIIKQNPGVLTVLSKIQDTYQKFRKLNKSDKDTTTLLQINNIIASSQELFSALEKNQRLDKKLKQQKKKLQVHYELLKTIEPYVNKAMPDRYRVRKIVSEMLKGKIKNEEKFVDMLINTYKILKKLASNDKIPTNFLQDENTFFETLKKIIKDNNEQLKKKLIEQLLKDKSLKSILEELLITNPFQIESEKELLEKMLEDKNYLEHTFNSYFEELFLSSDNQRTKEIGRLLKSLQEISGNKPKVDTVMFYKLFNSILQGSKSLGITPSESIALFFYVNGNSTDGKNLPVNYLHHNETIRQISYEILQNNKSLDELTPEQQFSLYVQNVLYKAIKKLPKVENVLLFRGENITPITYNAQKGDIIIYDTPVSTSNIEEKKGTQKFTEVNDKGEIIEYKVTTKQGAKSFARGGGNNLKLNKGIIEGKKPEQYEGHQQFLKKALKDLGEVPQGAVLNIKADIAYKLPDFFKTVVNIHQNEHLLPPGIALQVEGWYEGEKYGEKETKHRTENNGMYTVSLKTINSDILEQEDTCTTVLAHIYNVLKFLMNQSKKLKPKKKV